MLAATLLCYFFSKMKLRRDVLKHCDYTLFDDEPYEL